MPTFPVVLKKGNKYETVYITAHDKLAAEYLAVSSRGGVVSDEVTQTRQQTHTPGQANTH